VAKQTVADFVRGREYDRIGLVAFAGEALTQVPITIDYPVLYQSLAQLQRAGTGMLEDGTAIGTAMATAANRLRRVPGESRVIILLTDGENNRGEIDPVTAARAASAFDIKMHTIGVGSDGVAPIPIRRDRPACSTRQPARQHRRDAAARDRRPTGGQYFRATNEAALDRSTTVSTNSNGARCRSAAT
jgi:Ca-activated chloride channel homolog